MAVYTNKPDTHDSVIRRVSAFIRPVQLMQQRYAMVTQIGILANTIVNTALSRKALVFKESLQVQVTNEVYMSV